MKMLHGPLVHVGETVTDLQILGRELHQNLSVGWAPLLPFLFQDELMTTRTIN